MAVEVEDLVGGRRVGGALRRRRVERDVTPMRVPAAFAQYACWSATTLMPSCASMPLLTLTLTARRLACDRAVGHCERRLQRDLPTT
jgi:hypothetical protein